MNLIDRVIAAVAPAAGLRRARSRAALGALMHYEAASVGPRTGHRRAPGTDADAAADAASDAASGRTGSEREAAPVWQDSGRAHLLDDPA
jgi:hypothetical protein